MSALDQLDDIQHYGRLFTDLDLWAPYVKRVLARHGLQPRNPARTGVPGTCPTFIAGERWVVKFFGRLYDGAESFAAEREAGRLAGLDPHIRVARLAAEGELGEGAWPWPYLIFEYIPGASIGEVMHQLSFADMLQAARDLGETVRRLHGLPLGGSTVFPNSHAAHLRFLETQRAGAAERHRQWGCLPERLTGQIDDFIPLPEALVDRDRSPHLIHADLTRDHLLGRLIDGRWTSLALIDFGDAMTGGLPYELGALHLDLFAGDPRLLAAFLDAYELPADQRAGLPRKALSAALLHRFNLFEGLRGKAAAAESLEALARMVWGIDTGG